MLCLPYTDLDSSMQFIMFLASFSHSVNGYECRLCQRSSCTLYMNNNLMRQSTAAEFPYIHPPLQSTMPLVINLASEGCCEKGFMPPIRSVAPVAQEHDMTVFSSGVTMINLAFVVLMLPKSSHSSKSPVTKLNTPVHLSPLSKPSEMLPAHIPKCGGCVASWMIMADVR